MANKKVREFHCCVVNEEVLIHLCKRRTAGLRSRDKFFVQCNQDECQYVDENMLPCPLNLSLFEEEIQKREEKARLYQEASEF